MDRGPLCTEAATKVENRTHDVHIYGVGTAVLDGGDHNGLVERNSISAKSPTLPMGPLGHILPYPALVNTMISNPSAAVTDTTDEHDHDHEGEEAVEGTEETATEETEVPAE